MDKALCFSRTEKGRAELIGSQHALKPKQRQVLFMVADNVSLATLSTQLPNCTELEAIVQYLWDEGYIGLVSAGGTTAAKTNVADALALISTSRLEAARQHALTYLTPIVGEQSPVLQRIRAAQDTPCLQRGGRRGQETGGGGGLRQPCGRLRERGPGAARRLVAGLPRLRRAHRACDRDPPAP